MKTQGSWAIVPCFHCFISKYVLKTLSILADNKQFRYSFTYHYDVYAMVKGIESAVNSKTGSNSKGV